MPKSKKPRKKYKQREYCQQWITPKDKADLKNLIITWGLIAENTFKYGTASSRDHADLVEYFNWAGWLITRFPEFDGRLPINSADFINPAVQALIDIQKDVESGKRSGYVFRANELEAIQEGFAFLQPAMLSGIEDEPKKMVTQYWRMREAMFVNKNAKTDSIYSIKYKSCRGWYERRRKYCEEHGIEQFSFEDCPPNSISIPA